MRVVAVVGGLLLAAATGAHGYRVPAPASMMAAGLGQQQEQQRQRQMRELANSRRSRRWGR